MGEIDNHESLEILATHLVHEDCEHSDAENGGHCYDCTLAHLQKMARRAAITVATEYAYDHEHLGPDPATLHTRLEGMANRLLEIEVDRVPNRVEADPLCQTPGCYHPRAAHLCQPGGVQWICWRPGCACSNFQGEE